MTTSFTKLFFVLLLVGATQNLFSQSELQKIARAKKLEAEREKVFAESIAVKQGMPIRLDKADGTTIELIRFSEGRPVYYKTDNINSAKTISTNKVWPGGGQGLNLTGSGILLGEWDAGAARSAHQEFGGRVLSTQGANHQHSTHVAGTMIASGVNASAKGMAYQATLKSFNWSSDASEMATEAASGLRVSNHSYGSITGWDFDYFNDHRWAWFGDTAKSQLKDYDFGYYNSEAQSWDNIARNAPYYLIVVSAGNDRNEGPDPNFPVEHWIFAAGQWRLVVSQRNQDGGPNGYDCISGTSLAKNVLCVGAVNDITGGYSTPPGVVMTSFSSWGPTDDGRIKPDIVCNGYQLFSTIETANNAYGTLSGTSMAAPSATGSIGLLLEQYQNMNGNTNILSSTMKAIIINTADEAGTANGPDYIFGWGLMNTLKAVQLMRNDSIRGYGTHIGEQLLNQGSTIDIPLSVDGTQPFKGTICWTDPAGTPPTPSLDPPNIMLKNDLDMRLINNNDGTVYMPWVLDGSNPSAAATTGDNIRDNVEQVYVSSIPKGTYTLRITHKGTLAGGSQYVSYAVSGNVKNIGAYARYEADTVTYSLIPNDSTNDFYTIKNFGDTTYSFTFTPDGASWISYGTFPDSIPVTDSVVILVGINSSLLPQWTTYTSDVTVTSNDLSQPSKHIIFKLNVLGPKVSSLPSHVTIDAETSEVKADTIILRNNGYTPLTFWASAEEQSSPGVFSLSSATSPAWLTITPDSATLQPGDSVNMVLDFNATIQSRGDYYALLTVASNDSATGSISSPIDFHVATRRVISFDVNNRWNIVSVPNRTTSMVKTELFPSAVTNAFSFNGSYVPKDTLALGQGYWLKFGASESFNLDGYALIQDTIDVEQGWRIIGSLSYPAPVASVASDPPGIVSSQFFGYNSGYSMTDSIYPGKGYWVNLNQAGKIFFTTPYAAQPITTPVVPSTQTMSAREQLNLLNTITIRDAAGNSQTLYFGSRSSNLQVKPGMFAMPPMPPSEIFDARYKSGTFAEFIQSQGIERFPVSITSAQYPVTIEWNIKQRGTSSSLEINTKPVSLEHSGTAKITDNESPVVLILNGSTALPTEFSLEQNYPNPFNPSTIFSYSLPVNSQVSIKIYNMLGNEVATIVDGIQDAGYKTLEWNAGNMPSGVYYYKLTAYQTDGGRTFTDTKKLLFVK